MLNPVFIKATDLNDVWHQVIFTLLDQGRKFKIDKGSCVGEERLELDFVTIQITHPNARPLEPQIPDHLGIPNPIPPGYVLGDHPDFNGKPYIEYLMSGGKEPGEDYCYSKDTEILTENGWKLFSEILDDEKVATLNPDTDEIEYILPIKNHKFHYTGNMIKIKNKQISLMVTENHKHYFSNEKAQIFNLSNINTAFGKRIRHKKNGIWNGKELDTFTIPTAEYNNPRYNNYQHNTTFKMDDWLRFFGIWLADGSLRRYKNRFSYVVTITKSKIKERKFIYNEIVKPLFPNALMGENDKNIIISNKSLYEYLDIFGKSGDKYIPRELLNLSSRQLRILFSHMYFCDGNNTGFTFEKELLIPYFTRYSTKSKELADNIQEMCLKIGLSANIGHDGVYRVIINRDTKGSMSYIMPCTSKEDISYKQYNDLAYCVILPKNHILYVRREGSPVWSGNTYGERLCEAAISGIGYSDYSFNQIEKIIDIYKTSGYRNNQTVLQIAEPGDLLLTDPPCLRHIQVRIQDDKLHFFVYFRSWDAWAGLPANLAGIQILKEYMGGEIGVGDGEIIAVSGGLHIYGYVEEIAKLRRGL